MKEFKEYIENDAINLIEDLSKEVRKFEKQHDIEIIPNDHRDNKRSFIKNEKF